MGSLVERLKDWWLGLEKSQRPMWLLGGAFLALMVVGAVFFAGRPNMSLLFGGLNPSDQGMVVQELNKLGISAEYDANGNVLVPSNKVNEARARLAVAKKLPSSGNLGYGALDVMNPMISPEVEKEKIKAAIEGEIANSIQLMSGIASARVHLTLSDNSPFAREAKPASASIIVTEDGGSRLGPDQAQAIVRLVQFGVAGLGAENISLVNERGQTLYDGQEATGVTASADRKVAAEIEEARRREQDLQRKLDAAFGPGNTIVSIPVLTLNFDKISETSIERGPSAKPITKEETSEKMGDAGVSGMEGAAGAASNVQAPVDVTGQEKKNYTGTTKSEVYEINETQRSIQRSAGVLEGMTLSVLVNSTAITDAAPVESYVQSYLGPLSQQPEKFQASVTSTAFDTKTVAAVETASAAAAARDRNQQLISLLPIAALLVVGFLVMKSISKTAPPRPAALSMLDQVDVALPSGGTMSLPATAFQAMPAGSGHLTQNERGEQVIAIEGGELAQALHALAASSHAQIPIEDIPDRVNVPLEQIRKMALNKPDAVAKLIKTWILEERR